MIIVFFICGTIYSQSIINTIGVNGVFTINDVNANFLTLSQNTGNITLTRNLELGNISASTVTRGVITKNGVRFLHNYGTDNIFLGLLSGNFTMSGFSNTAFGNSSLESNTSGTCNSAYGNYSMQSNSSGYCNSSSGYGTLGYNTSGSYNSALGYLSLNKNSIGSDNSALGSLSLFNNTSGYYNSAFGYASLYFNTTGSSNSAFGLNSLTRNTTGYNNTAVGNSSLELNTTGAGNSAFGYNSGYNITTGYNNICIGNTTQVPSGSSNNQVRMGNSSITYAGIQVAWTITSDRNLKKNITNSNLGLGFINRLRPVSYIRINDESGKTEYGLIAQEVENVLKEEVAENTGMLTVTDNGEYQLRYNDLLAPMIKAIQELKSENDELKDRLNKYEFMQKAMLEEIEIMKMNTKIVNNE